MKKIAAAAVLIATLALAGCSSVPVEGFIYKKTVEPAHSTIMFIPCGKTQCPITQYMPECYKLEVDTPRQTTEALCVDEELWHELEVGQYFNEANQPT